MTQPTVSMQLRAMTGAVGLPIYAIIGRRLFLPEAGQELARSARAKLDEWDAFAQRIDRAEGLTDGRLREPVVNTTTYFVPRLLGVFCQRYPEIDVALEVLNRDGVVQRLRDNRDNLYFMSMPPQNSEIVSQTFMTNPLAVIAPRRHWLTGQRSLTLPQLDGDRFILRERGFGTRLACDVHWFVVHPRGKLCRRSRPPFSTSCAPAPMEPQQPVGLEQVGCKKSGKAAHFSANFCAHRTTIRLKSVKWGEQAFRPKAKARKSCARSHFSSFDPSSPTGCSQIVPLKQLQIPFDVSKSKACIHNEMAVR